MIRLAALLIWLAGAACAQETTYRILVTRVIDADTFDGTLYLDGLNQIMPGLRFRLDCINAPEKRTPEGKLLTGLVRHWIEGREVYASGLSDGGFSRLLASVRPAGWDETLEARLHSLRFWHSPLYSGSQTNRARMEACARRLK